MHARWNFSAGAIFSLGRSIRGDHRVRRFVRMVEKARHRRRDIQTGGPKEPPERRPRDFSLTLEE
jgi:hypothetical protein